MKQAQNHGEAVINDMKADVDLIKNIFKKHDSKIDELMNRPLDETTSGSSPLVRTITSPRPSRTMTFTKKKTSSPPPIRTENFVQKDEFKRILGLIENFSQAMGIQRDTFQNLMIRVQTLEKGGSPTKRADSILSPKLRGSELQKNNMSTLISEPMEANFMPAVRQGSNVRRKSSIKNNQTPDRLPATLRA